MSINNEAFHEFLDIYAEVVTNGSNKLKDFLTNLYLTNPQVFCRKSGNDTVIMNDANIMWALGRNMKIDAIKYFRAATGQSLKDSKDAIEDFISRYPACMGSSYFVGNQEETPKFS